ncbi:hypothetical protein CGJ11_22590 [Vibrio parahaemolyticus]|nr:hypothetical protein CGJ11_22590 [Vibrio parahaemolyticus]
MDKAKIAEKSEQMAKEKLEVWTKKFLTAPNAALRREQRNTQRIPHCALNTKFDANQKCHAL